MSMLTHTTHFGEKLDQIAWTYYGDVSKVPLLIEANPRLPIKRNYPAGVVIYIPLIQQQNTTEDLPPWLQP
jgi:phage tail protein X